MNNLEFQVHTTLGCKKTYTILNEGKECISVSVKHNNLSELHLSMLRFYDTMDTILLLKELFRFIATNETFTKIVFDDLTTYRDITMYGKTLYERHFNAILLDSTTRELINKSISNLQSIIDNNAIYNRLTKFIHHVIKLTETQEFRNVLNFLLEILDNALKSSSCSWMNLFANVFSSTGEIATKYGSQYSCSLYDVLDVAINQLFEIPFECERLDVYITKETIMMW